MQSSCSSLFLILERVTVNLRDLHGEELASRAKYAELVMKVWGFYLSCSQTTPITEAIATVSLEDLQIGSRKPRKRLAGLKKAPARY